MNIKITTSVTENTSLLKLMQLTSPLLPIGSYAYSQGLECAVDLGWVDGPSSASDWIQGFLQNSIKYLDVPIFERLYRSWQENQIEAVLNWDRYLIASRDAFELQEEDRQLGKALARLLKDLDLEYAENFLQKPFGCFLTLYSLAAVKWNVSLTNAGNGFLWMWSENQVLAAMKLVPFGQTAGQKILSEIIEIIPRIVSQGLALKDVDIGYTAPGQAIASALHETQYTRLFRS